MSLSNRHLGERDGFELVEVHFSRPSLFAQNMCPTIPSLCDFVMRAGYPKPSEVKRVTHWNTRHGRAYRLHIKRDPCPAILLPGQTVCPLCREEHPC